MRAIEGIKNNYLENISWQQPHTLSAEDGLIKHWLLNCIYGELNVRSIYWTWYSKEIYFKTLNFYYQISKTVNTCLKSCDRRDLAMKADTGQIEPLEGVVQVSESLAKKPDVKVIVQVWTNCMLCSECFYQVLLRLFSSFGTDERMRNWWDFSSVMRWSSPVGQFSPQHQSRPPLLRVLHQYQLSLAVRSTENVCIASQCKIGNFGRCMC